MEDRIHRPKVDGLNLPHLDEGQADWLEKLFEEEVKKVVWLMEGDKPLALDGFTLAFYKSCWEVIKADLMLVVRDFFDRTFLDKGSNATYIALIPKEGANRILDFRPVSLAGSTYKIISKCLAMRLKQVLASIVSK